MDENYGEGIYRGSLANAIAGGMPVWPRHMAEIPHVPGSIVVGYVAAPFYHIFGPTMFSLRMAGTLFHLAALTFFMLLVHRRLGRWAAILGGLLFTFAPAGFAKMAVLSYGDHVESLPFIFAAAFCNLEWAGARERTPWWLAFGAGFTTTLAAGFHLQATLGVASLGIVCALIALPRLITMQFWREAILGFVPGAVAGALPAVAVYSYTTSSALTLWGKSAASHVSGEGKTMSEVLFKFWDFWRNGLSYGFQWPPEYRFLADSILVMSAVCAAALLAGAIRKMRNGTLTPRLFVQNSMFFAAYPAVFSIVFGFSSDNFKLDTGTANALEVRYVLPVLPIVLLPIAVAAARLMESGRRVAGAILFIPAFVLGAAGSISTWDLDIIKNEPARRGFLLEEFNGHLLFASLPKERRETFLKAEATFGAGAEGREAAAKLLANAAIATDVLALIQRVDTLPQWTRPMRYAAPRVPVGEPSDPRGAAAWLAGVPAPARLHACVAAGRIAASAEPFAPGAARMLFQSTTDPAETLYLSRGFGMGLIDVCYDGHPQRPRFFDAKKSAARLEQIKAVGDQEEASFGLGFQIGAIVNEFFQPGDTMIARVVADFPVELLPSFSRGLGAGYRMRFLQPPPADTPSPGARRLEQLLPRLARKDFRAGLGGAAFAK